MLLPAAIALRPLSIFYGAATRARRALYRAGALTTYRIDKPVISVGNITAGGTGKTPLVAWLARKIAREGYRVCILTRGYGRPDSSRRVVVSDGDRLLADARTGGDEPRLLAEMLQGTRTAVISDRQRIAAARWAMVNLGSEVFILDDGFQHLGMWRDLDIVTVDATDPWGGGRLLPEGLLREPVRELSRAGCVVITRANQARHLAGLREGVQRLSGGQTPVFTSRMHTFSVRPLVLSDVTTPGTSQERSLPQPLAAFCALGNPQSFFAHLRSDGYTLAYTRAFPDHHVYMQGDVDALVREATSCGARSLLTTAKDAVKLGFLSFNLPCYVIEIEFEFDNEYRFAEIVRRAISRVGPHCRGKMMSC